ncbi:MAG: hypothetical protein IT305_06380 [Chloroflexi bacterium]|nr:hypothetical protein [Chloroflexota bacterium]
MRVGEAKRLAADWVRQEGCRLPGVIGAYIAGSANWLADDDLLPRTSDLDLNLVVADDHPAPERIKLQREELTIEVSSIPLASLRTSEMVLADFALAGGFRVPSVLYDATGHLAELQRSVEERYADPTWVLRRCRHAERRALGYLDALTAEQPFHEQAIIWLFGVSIPTLLPLIASLRNPTVRRRYVAAREALAERGESALHERLLRLLGCADHTRGQVDRQVSMLADLFDVAAAARRSAFSFSADISPETRRIAIDGSRELIDGGLHREAVFWIAVTAARCQTILSADAPAEAGRFEPAFRALLADLGIRSPSDMRARADEVRALLPAVWTVVHRIVGADA